MDNIVVNENNAKHFFQWKKPQLKIEVYFGDTLLASTQKPVLLKEMGREIYDNVFYIPMEDVRKDLLILDDKHTHCPIKGDCSYFSYEHNGTIIQDVAWSYIEPIEKSIVIRNHIAFYADKVKFIIEPLNHVK